MTFKYQNEIQNLNCDLSSFQEIERTSYRWTFEKIEDSRNFEPVLISAPNRIELIGCLGFALSFFVTKEAGIKRHNTLTLNKPKLFKKLGSHIASGDLVKTDGIANEPDELKHFDFFEYENIDLSSKFTVLKSII